MFRGENVLADFYKHFQTLYNQKNKINQTLFNYRCLYKVVTMELRSYCFSFLINTFDKHEI